MKKIALVIDTEDWAFANIARNIKENLLNYYQFKIIPIANLENNVVKVLIEADDCDLIHFFWRGVILQINSKEYQEYLKSINKDVNKFNKRYLSNKVITTNVPDHLFLEEDKIDITKEIFSKCSNYYVSSKKLLNLYNNLDIEYSPYGVISDGINLNIFYPKRENKFKNIYNRKIKIGWVGNSAWNNSNEDYKGVNTILKPAINELIEEGYPIETCFADKQEGMIPHDKMVDYYDSIDILVCSSKQEGTPLPILEAMACGNIIVSTNVGIVQEALGKKQSNFILKERTKDCLKEKLVELINQRELFEELSKENLERIKKYDWKIISKKLKNFYDDALNKEIRGTKMNYNKQIEENEKEIYRLKLILEATEQENNYMKKNIKKKNKKIKKITNSKVYKLSNKISKIREKLTFWRKK